MDWTKLTDDPNDRKARNLVLAELLAKRRICADRDMMDYVLERIQGKRVLDIGIISHAERYITQGNWRHEAVRNAAGYCLGIDILADLVEKLKASGYNVRVADATSEEYLGELFEVVFIGDVVEHVDNPVNLLKFAKRHLAPGGAILVSTPNPFSRKFYRRFRREGTCVVNLDHMAWITPTMAMEIARRAGLELRHYHLIKKTPSGLLSQALKRLAWKATPVEFSFPDFLYEFSLP